MLKTIVLLNSFVETDILPSEMNDFIKQICIKLIKSGIKDIYNVIMISVSNKWFFLTLFIK